MASWLDTITSLPQTLRGWFYGNKSVNMLVAGKTGAGKSSLINGLLGQEVAETGDKLDTVTVHVEAFSFKYHSMDITIWDSPGLQVFGEKEEEYIRDMKSKGCGNSDVILFCKRIIDPGLGPSDRHTIRKLTIGLGKQIWSNAIFVMTFANHFVANLPDLKISNDTETGYFKARLEQWREKLVSAVINEAGVDVQIAASIPIVPAGIIKTKLAHDDWFSSLWSIVMLLRMNHSQSAHVQIQLQNAVISQIHEKLIQDLLQDHISTITLLNGSGVKSNDLEEKKLTMQIQDVVPLLEGGYICVAHNSLCQVYLPQEINEKISIETVTDANIHPKIANNEIKLTPTVRITPDNIPSLSLKKPAIIELVKTIELSDKETKNEIFPLCADSGSFTWKELGSECNCKVFNDRISFEVTHFSFYTVISRKHYPSSTIKVKPFADTLAVNVLTISELSGFKVEIPPSSINTETETDITATILYDCPAVCSDNERSRLASSCIELEPHGITFSKAVSISIPIPNYAEVKKHHPSAELQIWHSDQHSDHFTDSKLNQKWNLVKYFISQDEEDRYIAFICAKHFSWYKPLWDICVWAKSQLFCTPFCIKERCQVFMSQETRLKPSKDITFSIVILFYPYKEDPEPIPRNYKYMLLDSGLLDLEVSNDDTLFFGIDLNEKLYPKKHKSITGLFVISGRQQKSFTIELDGQIELRGGFPMGELSIGATSKAHCCQSLSLIKPANEASISELTSCQGASISAANNQFEENVVAIEDAAEKLCKKATQYEGNPGPMVEAVKRIADMWMKMAQLMRNDHANEEQTLSFKEDIVDLARNMNKETQEVVRIAERVAHSCTDKIMRKDVSGVVNEIETISHQLRILTVGEASRQRDKASDLEVCNLLTTNAKTLTLAICNALSYTQSASIRVAKATVKELGLNETEAAIGMLSQVKDNILEDSNQDFNKESVVLTWSTGREEEKGHLIPNDLQKVQNMIWEARVQWYNLGLELKITPDTLDAIELNSAHNPERCFRAMLTRWLQKRPTWSALAEALKTPTVGLDHLAEEILSELNL